MTRKSPPEPVRAQLQMPPFSKSSFRRNVRFPRGRLRRVRNRRTKTSRTMGSIYTTVLARLWKLCCFHVGWNFGGQVCPEGWHVQGGNSHQFTCKGHTPIIALVQIFGSALAITPAVPAYILVRIEPSNLNRVVGALPSHVGNGRKDTNLFVVEPMTTEEVTWMPYTVASSTLSQEQRSRSALQRRKVRNPVPIFETDDQVSKLVEWSENAIGGD